MCLAAMLSEGRDELICDFAETYHVLDFWALPIRLMATLAAGLRENSRIRMKMAKMTYIPLEIVAPRIADTLSAIACGLAGKNAKMPPLLTDLMMSEKKEDESPVTAYDSAEDFAAAWARLTHKE